MSVPCAFDGCTANAQRQGLCWGHLRQKRLQRPLRKLRDRSGPKDAFMGAVLNYLELAPTDDAGWQRAWNRLRRAAHRYVEADKATVGRPKSRDVERGQPDEVHASSDAEGC